MKLHPSIADVEKRYAVTNDNYSDTACLAIPGTAAHTSPMPVFSYYRYNNPLLLFAFFQTQARVAGSDGLTNFRFPA